MCCETKKYFTSKGYFIFYLHMTLILILIKLKNDKRLSYIRYVVGDGGVMGAHAHLKKKFKRFSFSDANCFQTVKTFELLQGFAPLPSTKAFL